MVPPYVYAKGWVALRQVSSEGWHGSPSGWNGAQWPTPRIVCKVSRVVSRCQDPGYLDPLEVTLLSQTEQEEQELTWNVRVSLASSRDPSWTCPCSLAAPFSNEHTLWKEMGRHWGPQSLTHTVPAYLVLVFTPAAAGEGREFLLVPCRGSSRTWQRTVSATLHRGLVRPSPAFCVWSLLGTA